MNASDWSAFASPRNRLETEAKIPARDSGRMSANQRSLGRIANAIPRSMGVMPTSRATLAAMLACVMNSMLYERTSG